MQMLQISGVLELRSHQLQRDALKLINSTICGTATMDFWKLMESYFGVDEDIDEAALDKAQSLTEILQLKSQSESKNAPSVSKKSAEASTRAADNDIWDVLMWFDSEAAARVSGAAETVDYFG